MKRTLCAAVAAAVVASVGFPLSASAAPPVNPPDGSTCTFHSGLTTCVQSTGLGSVTLVIIDDPSCASGQAERRTETLTTVTTTTIFRGTQQLGDPQTETTSSTSVTTTCVPA